MNNKPNMKPKIMTIDGTTIILVPWESTPWLFDVHINEIKEDEHVGYIQVCLNLKPWKGILRSNASTKFYSTQKQAVKALYKMWKMEKDTKEKYDKKNETR